MKEMYAMVRINKQNPNDYGLCHLRCNDAERSAALAGDCEIQHAGHYDKLSGNFETVLAETTQMNKRWGHEETYLIAKLEFV